MVIQTRDGIKSVDSAGDEFTADMGSPEVLDDTVVSVMGHDFPARLCGEGLEHTVVDVQVEESHRAIGHQEVCAPRMIRPKVEVVSPIVTAAAQADRRG